MSASSHRRRILIATDSFKGTFTAAQVASHIASGARAAGATTVELPVADGGEGTTEILSAAMGARAVRVETVGPWRDSLIAAYGLTEDGTALLDVAAASGIALPCHGERDPMTADTYGTGLLMADAASRGARRILVAAGGSATTDGGTGALTAIREHGGLRNVAVTVLSDVSTPFEDASRVFGAQKGASPRVIEQLTDRLDRQAAGFPRDPRGVPATGAAGGFSGAMWANLGADLVSGARFVLDTVGFDEQAGTADAVVVGEGRLDAQTREGKIISAILDRRRHLPVYAVVGSLGADLGSYADNFTDVLVSPDSAALQKAGRRVAESLDRHLSLHQRAGQPDRPLVTQRRTP